MSVTQISRVLTIAFIPADQDEHALKIPDQRFDLNITILDPHVCFKRPQIPISASVPKDGEHRTLSGEQL